MEIRGQVNREGRGLLPGSDLGSYWVNSPRTRSMLRRTVSVPVSKSASFRYSAKGLGLPWAGGAEPSGRSCVHEPWL